MADLTMIDGGKEKQTLSMELTYNDGEIQKCMGIEETQIIDYVLRFTLNDGSCYLVNMETVKRVKTWPV